MYYHILVHQRIVNTKKKKAIFLSFAALACAALVSCGNNDSKTTADDLDSNNIYAKVA